MWITPAAELTDRMAQQWALSAYSAVPVEYDNFEITRPNPDPNNAISTSFVRQTILPDTTVGLTFTRDHTFGVAVYAVYGPINSALGNLLNMAQEIRSYFNRYESNGMVCIGLDGSGPSVAQIGRDDQIGFHQVNVTVPWQYFDDATGGAPAMNANQQYVTQAAHGFDNEWVGLNGSTWVLADETYEAVAFATSVDANSFLATFNGPVTWTGHGLTVGAKVYLHATTDGGSQTTEPSGGERYQRTANVLDTNTINVRIEPLL